MNTYKLSNITLSVFRDFLSDIGCVYVGTKGGHEKWRKEGCDRPIIFQTHFKVIPEFILKNNLAVLGITRKEFIDWLKR